MAAFLMVVVLISLAFVAQELFRFLKLPRALAYILVGLLLGLEPFRSALFDAENGQVLEFLAQVGIVLLFFFSGLEISLKQFIRHIPSSLKVSAFNTLIPLVAGFLFAKQLGFSDQAAAVVGFSLSVAAASYAIDMLEEMGLLNSRLAQTIISIATVDDVLEVGVIALLLASIRFQGSYLEVGLLFGKFVAFCLIFLFFRQVLAPRIIQLANTEKSHATHLTAALIITLLLAVIAEGLGFGALVGAMFGGILVRHILLSKTVHKPWEQHQLTESVHTFAFGFFVPMFFIWVGYNTDLAALTGQWWLGVAFAVIATLGNILGTVIGLLLSKKSLGEGFVVGTGLNGKGDVELVIVALAKSMGIIDTQLFSALVLMAVLTMIASPFLFRFALQRCKPELLQDHEINQKQAASY